MNGIVSRSVQVLRSPALTVWLVGLFVLYYLSMAVWSREAFGTYIMHLSSNNLFRAFYLVFLANVALRIGGGILRSRPFGLRACLQLPVLAGIPLFLAALFLSLNLRKTITLPPVGQGDVISIPWSGEQYKITSVEPALKKKTLRPPGAAVFDFEPGVMLMGNDGTAHNVRAFPARSVGATYIHVLTFGLAPGVELSKGGKVLYRGEVALRLAPLGTTDAFDLPQAPFRFYLSILPSNTIKRGKELAFQYDLERPTYKIDIVKGDKTVLRESTNASVSFDSGYTLRFYQPADWVMLELAYDPFLAWFLVSALMVTIGIPAYGASFLVPMREGHSSNGR